MAKSDRFKIFIEKHKNETSWHTKHDTKEKRKQLLDRLKNKSKNKE